MKENVVYEKSKEFAIRIVNLYKYLCDTKKEYVLSKQILRSGTSIGANIAESECAISKKDFLSKLYIAYSIKSNIGNLILQGNRTKESRKFVKNNA